MRQSLSRLWSGRTGLSSSENIVEELASLGIGSGKALPVPARPKSPKAEVLIRTCEVTPLVNRDLGTSLAGFCRWWDRLRHALARSKR